MPQNEKIRSEDVVEILDVKILTAQGHPAIGVLPRENYDSVTTKIAQQVLTPDEKLAFDNTLTVPSATNPVVLRDDLGTYVPQADLGNTKDSVATFADLPVPFTITADTTSGSSVITNVSDTSDLEIGQGITGAGIAANATIVEITPAVKLFGQSTASATGVTLTVSPQVNDLRPVQADGVIYRWTGTAWDPFIRTGTLDHTQLTNQNGDANYQHLTLAEKTLLLSQTHTHPNKVVLDGILNAGSGQIITVQERANLPTTDQKAALVGTSGTPNASNPYVTSQDPRLNAVRNPYVTIGPPGSLASHQGVDFRPFEDALANISVGSATAVKAIEVLPGFYTLGGVAIKWDNQDSAILIENFTPGTATLNFQTFQAGVQALLPGTGALILRGFNFELNDLGTSGVLTQRPGSVIEDCVFQPGPTTSANQVGVFLAGANSMVRRCTFIGALAKGVVVQAANCRVEDCIFNFVNPLGPGVEFEAAAAYSFATRNHFLGATLRVNTGAANCQISHNYFASITAITDNGANTRILENQPQDVNQPFVGRIRTVGPLESYADFRGLTEAPILAALADPNVQEVQILEGTYACAQTIVVPQGKTLRGATNGSAAVQLVGADGVTLIQLASNVRIENLQLTSTNGPTLIAPASASKILLQNLKATLTAFNSADDYCCSLATPIDCTIRDCVFSGPRGVSLNNSTRSRVYNSHFNNSLITLQSTSGTDDHFKDNHFFVSTPAPIFSGTRFIIEGNHFLGTLPTKIQTSSSIWQANFPAPQANNENGVDNLVLSLSNYFEPTSIGAFRGVIAGTGAIEFTPNEVSSAATYPVALLAKVNRNLGFSVRVFWTAPTVTLPAGSVVWRITATFRDRIGHLIGTPIVHSVVSPRTQNAPIDEETAVVSFSNLEYGLALGNLPSHVAVVVERVGTNAQDTLLSNAHLLEVEITIPRD